MTHRWLTKLVVVTAGMLVAAIAVLEFLVWLALFIFIPWLIWKIATLPSP